MAQKVIVKEDQQKIQETKRKGMSTLIKLDYKTVKNTWKEYLKQFGKVTSSGEYFFMEGATMAGVSTEGLVNVYSIVKETQEGVLVFWCIDLGTSYLTSESKQYEEAQRYLHRFGVKCYQDEVQKQINDAENALFTTAKQQQKTVDEGYRLEQNLEKNASEKIKLEQLLVDNGNEKVMLDSLTIVNKEQQKNMELEVLKMQKALELIKQKMNQIE